MKTNIETVSDFMSYGSAINQMFVIDAITKLADAWAKADDATVAAAQENMPLINMEAWRAAGIEWLELIEKRDRDTRK